MQTPIQLVPAVRDLVLIGGGHSHVQVLKAFAMRPQPGIRITLITRDLLTPYSGMLPGAVAGVYRPEEIFIKLQGLSQFAGARLIHAEASGLDPAARQIQFCDRPPLRYDIVSINCGATPLAPESGAITVKPISQFLPKWQMLTRSISESQSLAIIGSGAGGVELAFAARHALDKQVGPGVQIHLVGSHLLAGHNAAARELARRALSEAHIEWHEDRALAHRDGRLLTLASGESLLCDHALWVTDVRAPAWLSDAGLQTDERGFMKVNSHLQSVSHPEIFGAGDVVDLVGQPRPKSGVYAVRAGPVLAQNLRRVLTGRRLLSYKAQKKHLALIGLANGTALASRGGWASSNALWWRMKRRIDIRFINKFNQLPVIHQAIVKLPGPLRAAHDLQSMRCGGCGAKLAADPLKRVLARLPTQSRDSVPLGIGDDAAEVVNSSGSTLLTVDGFRAMLDDPYLFGRIAAHHSLNDIFAMAAQPSAALALVTLPLMAEALMEEDLFQILSGVVTVLNAHDVALVGGHSAEGSELSIGLTIAGQRGRENLLKSGAQIGDLLILTKPLGSGCLMAAAMQGKAPADGVIAAIAGMDQSNAPAVEVFVNHEANALTDITGFGLIGHLSEILRASSMGATVEVANIRSYPGALATIVHVASSLQDANELALHDFELRGSLSFADAQVRMLADPQTSGGLLGSIPEAHAEAVLEALSALGFDACCIGRISPPGEMIIQ
jgi:selenide,water dikinase